MQSSQTHLKQSIRQTCILKLRICILKQDLFSNEIQSLYSQHNRIIQVWNCTAALPLCTNEQDLGRTLLGKRQMLYVIKQLRPKVKKISKGHLLPLFVYFRSFSIQTNNTFLTRSQYEKCHVHVQCRDSNPRPLDHESSPITTRPELPPIKG